MSSDVLATQIMTDDDCPNMPDIALMACYTPYAPVKPIPLSLRVEVNDPSSETLLEWRGYNSRVVEIFDECLATHHFRNKEKFMCFFSNASRIALVRCNGKIISTAFLMDIGESGHHAFMASIDYIMTDPVERGRGGGGAATQALVQTAKQRGIPWVLLTCKPTLIPYYEEFGFRRIRTPKKR